MSGRNSFINSQVGKRYESFAYFIFNSTLIKLNKVTNRVNCQVGINGIDYSLTVSYLIGISQLISNEIIHGYKKPAVE